MQGLRVGTGQQRFTRERVLLLGPMAMITKGKLLINALLATGPVDSCPRCDTGS
jgi:hypothetical protein